MYGRRSARLEMAVMLPAKTPCHLCCGAQGTRFTTTKKHYGYAPAAAGIATPLAQWSAGSSPATQALRASRKYGEIGVRRCPTGQLGNHKYKPKMGSSDRSE